MSRVKRGGYFFVTWIGDHEPKHVHVFSGNKLVLKYDLASRAVLKGTLTARLQKLINEVQAEGRL